MTSYYANAQFISDLHLTEDRPDCIRAFFRYLQALPTETEALFILGDFFEYWVGDDVSSELSESIAAALRKTKTEKNIDLYLVAGNRDFAIGKDYCDQCAMTLIKDNTCFSIAQQTVLVCHGDLFCTSDVSYQRLRKIIRNPLVLFLLKSLPKKQRLKLAEKLRAKSKQQFSMRQSIIDVDEPAVIETFKQSQADVIVHGHTHIADVHYHEINGLQKTRMVLGDWHDTGWNGVMSAEGIELQRFKICD